MAQDDPLTSIVPYFKASSLTLPCIQCQNGHRHSSVLDLELTANAGCGRCGIFLHSTQRLFGRELAGYRIFDSVSNVSNVEMFTLSGEQECSIPWVSVRNPTRDRFSSEYLAKLTSWLEDCTLHHTCAPPDAPLPTRVLDVGAKTSNLVRLYVSHQEPARYIAFSHCWGSNSSNHVRTTRETLKAHLSGFQLHDLPKSYREVISVAKNLGIRYVW